MCSVSIKNHSILSQPIINFIPIKCKVIRCNLSSICSEGWVICICIQLASSNISLTNILKRSGPIKLPCGTPISTLIKSDNMISCQTACFLPISNNFLKLARNHWIPCKFYTSPEVILNKLNRRLHLGPIKQSYWPLPL